ncbi:dihydrofolate reductase [Methylobrevis albus]|uniref:Dihydrofolate reductase n=1 Tax=Methylobrevis albus TaxID=2793297 RepID=A0A931HYN9_9HYPH|nr:dihydrofolate reductase [Methylobrevis albus]MBH0236715.1 dihydrofolate reductase [Methylobrevis albus]
MTAVAMIVAVAENGVIGHDGGMPWHLSSDLKRFRQITMGKPVLMGRRTFQSIGRPLDGRANIVVTSDPEFAPDGVTVVRSAEAALAAGIAAAGADGAAEVMVIGGGALYRALIGRAGRLYVTHVAAAPDGDTTFPEIDPAVWHAVSSEPIPQGPRDSAAARLVVYERSGEGATTDAAGARP